jgi:Leucine-rich repeat (LRR) protein
MNEISRMQQLAGINEIKVLSPESFGINSKGERIVFTVENFTIDANNKDLVKLVIKDKTVKDVFCYDNKLTSLDVSNLPSLELLFCYNNNLTSLDISNSPNLETLYYDNGITKLIK